MDHKLDLAFKFLRHGNSNAAIDLLRQLLAGDPDNSEAHAILSQALLSQLRVEAALHEANLALQLDPNSSISHYAMARCQLLKSQPGKALQAADDAIKLEPMDHHNYLLKSACLDQLQRKDESKQALDRALELEPNSTEVLVAHGNHYLDTGDYQKAGEMALSALADNAGDSNAHLLLGRVKLRNDDSHGAKEHAIFAIQQAPNDTDALTLFAEIKAKTNPLMGIWYKFNTFMSTLSSTKQIAWLIGAFVLFSFCSQILRDLGYAKAALIVSFFWIGLVIYSWVGVPYFKRLVNKEISKVQLSSEF